jgi:hypothetical protein
MAPHFIPAERIPALSWQAWVQSVSTFTTIYISNRKICSIWALHHLTDGHKTTQMGSFLMLLQHNGEAFSSRTVTRDETWVFHDTPENKVESITWMHLYSPVKEKFTTVQSPEKVMATVFCDVYRVLLVDCTPHGPTINVAA